MRFRIPVVEISDHRNVSGIGRPNGKIISRGSSTFRDGIRKFHTSGNGSLLEIADVRIGEKGVVPHGFCGIDKMGMFVTGDHMLSLFLNVRSFVHAGRLDLALLIRISPASYTNNTLMAAQNRKNPASTMA